MSNHLQKRWCPTCERSRRLRPIHGIHICPVCRHGHKFELRPVPDLPILPPKKEK